MKNKIKLFLATLIFIGMIIPSIAQTSGGSWGSSTTSSGRGFRSRLGTDNDNDNNNNRQSIVYDFVRALIAGKLRHPDPKVRIQAIQTITGSMISSSGDDSDTNEGGARNLFSIGNNDDSDDDNDTTSVGAAVYIPDLYALLSDPDPEVRDTASVALDALFGTDTTLIRLMEDSDPIVRKYATKIYAKRVFSNTSDNDDDDDDNNDTDDLRELLALRTFLVRLKYEKNPEVRKVITDTIEYYLRSNINEDNENKNLGYMGGIDSSMYTYLKDPNPEIRKNAIKIISQLDYNPRLLTTLMEMLKTEKDESVKAAIQKAIDAFIRKEKQFQAGETETLGR